MSIIAKNFCKKDMILSAVLCFVAVFMYVFMQARDSVQLDFGGTPLVFSSAYTIITINMLLIISLLFFCNSLRWGLVFGFERASTVSITMAVGITLLLAIISISYREFTSTVATNILNLNLSASGLSDSDKKTRKLLEITAKGKFVPDQQNIKQGKYDQIAYSKFNKSESNDRIIKITSINVAEGRVDFVTDKDLKITDSVHALSIRSAKYSAIDFLIGRPIILFVLTNALFTILFFALMVHIALENLKIYGMRTVHADE